MNVPGEGPVNLSVEELGNLASFGYMQLKKGKESNTGSNTGSNTSSNTSSSEPLSTEDQVVQLQKQIAELKNERTTESNTLKMKQELHQASQQFDGTKSDSEYANSVAVETLALISMNPRLTTQQAYKTVYDLRERQFTKRLEAEKSKSNGNRKVQAMVDGIQRGGGTSPNVDTTKKYTPDDVRKGVARRTLQEMLETMDKE